MTDLPMVSRTTQWSVIRSVPVVLAVSDPSCGGMTASGPHGVVGDVDATGSESLGLAARAGVGLDRVACDVAIAAGPAQLAVANNATKETVARVSRPGFRWIVDGILRSLWFAIAWDTRTRHWSG
jgi:hypothetical protein